MSKRGSKAAGKPDCMAEVSKQVGVHEQQSLKGVLNSEEFINSNS